MEKISFVIPCYRSENTIEKVVAEIEETLRESEYDYQIVLVNDSSPDNVWNKIENLTYEHRVKGVNLTKNFGQASAIMAGFSQADGDYIIVMDDDGQSPVDATLPILNKLKEDDADAVYGVSNDTQFNLFRRIGSKINGMMSNAMFGLPSDQHIVSFYVVTRQIKEEICKYDYPYTYISGLVFRTTNKVSYLDVTHRSRIEGKSGYTFKKLLGAWLNGFTAFSIKPLRTISFTGMVVALLGFLSCLAVIIYKLCVPDVNVGWSSIVSVILFIGGLNLLMLGLIGEYIGRMYMCMNKTPQYVIREVKNEQQ